MGYNTPSFPNSTITMKYASNGGSHKGLSEFMNTPVLAPFYMNTEIRTFLYKCEHQLTQQICYKEVPLQF